MTTTETPTKTRLELAQRESGGFIITLYFDTVEERPLVQVTDQCASSVDAWYVPADKAMDAFEHPFVYEPRLMASRP